MKNFLSISVFALNLGFCALCQADTVASVQKERLRLHEAIVKTLISDYDRGVVSYEAVVRGEIKLVRLQYKLKVKYSDPVDYRKKRVELEEQRFRVLERNFRAGATEVTPLALQKARLRILKQKELLLSLLEKPSN